MAFSVAIPFIMNSAAPFIRVLTCDDPLVDLVAKSSEAAEKTPHPLLFPAPSLKSPPPQVLGTPHSSTVPYAPQAPRTESASMISLLIFRKCQGRLSGGEYVDTFVLPCSEAARHEIAVDSTQRVVGARVWTLCDVAV